MDFFVRVRNTYLEYAKEHPNEVKVVSGEQALEKVSSDIKILLDELHV